MMKEGVWLFDNKVQFRTLFLIKKTAQVEIDPEGQENDKTRVLFSLSPISFIFHQCTLLVGSIIHEWPFSIYN